MFLDRSGSPEVAVNAPKGTEQQSPRLLERVRGVRKGVGTALAVGALGVMANGAVGCSNEEYCGYEKRIDGEDHIVYVCRDNDGDIQSEKNVPAGTCVVESVQRTTDGSVVYGCMGGGTMIAPPNSGAPGNDGIDGQSCAVTKAGDTCTMTCDNSAVSWNCQDGNPGSSGGSEQTGVTVCEWNGAPNSGLPLAAQRFYSPEGMNAWNCESVMQGGSYNRENMVVVGEGSQKLTLVLSGGANCAVATQWGTQGPFSTNEYGYIDVDSNGFATVCNGSVTARTTAFGGN